MANWDSLKPLKNHVWFVSIVVVMLLLILVLTPKRGFENPESISIDNEYRVKAKSGLSIRDQPNVDGILINSAPYHSILKLLEDNVSTDHINGRSGTWCKVEFEGQVGYAWGNYIEK